MSRTIRHIHISKPSSLIKYADAAKIQDHFVRLNLDHRLSPGTALAPPPTILTMEMAPVYTFGRRQITDPDTSRQIYRLEKEADGADCVVTQRGGQTTFHGPGQLVSYPILDLKEFNVCSVLLDF